MKVVFVGDVAGGKSYVAVIQCEHCANGTVAYKPVKEAVLRVAFCGECMRNSAGEISPLDVAIFK